MLHRWRAVGNTVSDLTGTRFEPQISRSRDEHVTARLTDDEEYFYIKFCFDVIKVCNCS